jgi:hypothetical protein
VRHEGCGAGWHLNLAAHAVRGATAAPLGYYSRLAESETVKKSTWFVILFVALVIAVLYVWGALAQLTGK